MDKTQQELLYEAACLWGRVHTAERMIRDCRTWIDKLQSGQLQEVVGGIARKPFTVEILQRHAERMEAEIAPIRQRARELQDRAMGKG